MLTIFFKRACESFPLGNLPFLHNYHMAFSSLFKLIGKLDSLEKALEAWGILLHNYTRCSLTVERDRLVAISAVAKELSQLLGNEYLAGLWRKHLPHELLWRVAPGIEPSNRICPYYAPS